MSGGPATFEICVMRADCSDQTQLTFNSVPDFTPSFSLDGTQIVLHRNVGTGDELYRMNADRTDVVQLTDTKVSTCSRRRAW